MTVGLVLQHATALCFTDKSEKGERGGVKLDVFFNSILALTVLYCEAAASAVY